MVVNRSWHYLTIRDRATAMPKNHMGSRALKPRIKSFTQWLWAGLAMIGFAVLINGGVRVHRMLASQGWPVIAGTVVTSELQRGYLREGGQKYKVRILYRYTVGGTGYQSCRISFGASAQKHEQTRSILERYPSGHRVSVHYNPVDPSLAVLETVDPWQGVQGLLFGMLLASLGVTGFWLRWPLQSDYLFRERDPDQPLTKQAIFLGLLGLLTWLGIGWLWWELIKMYAGR